MEKDRIKKGIAEIKNITLSESERANLFARLDHYSTVDKKIPSPSYWYQAFLSGHYVQVAFALVLFIGGGMVLNSNEALPGDALYSLKVNISEPIRSVSLFDTSSKVAWETEKLDRRLAEVEVLAVQGKLNEKVSTNIQNKIEQYNRSFEVMVTQQQEESGESEAQDSRDAFGAKIEAHDRILSKIENAQENGVRNQIVKIRNSIYAQGSQNVAPQAAMMVFSAKVAPAKNTISTSTYELKKKNVESKIKKMEDSQKKMEVSNVEEEHSLKFDLVSDFKNDLQEAIDSYNEAKNKEAEGNLDEAVENLNASLKSLEKASISLRQSIRFERD